MTKKIPRWIRLDQAEAMFKAAKNSRDKLAMMLMFYAGMRIGEVVKLTGKDIDFVDGTIFVRQGKGAKDRIIPAPKILLTELAKYLDIKTFEEIYGDNSQHLVNVCIRHLRNIIKQAAVDAKIPRPEEIHPHTLRHSYATHLYNENVDLFSIKTFLGHSNIKTTTMYTHMGMKKARDVVDGAFG